MPLLAARDGGKMVCARSLFGSFAAYHFCSVQCDAARLLRMDSLTNAFTMITPRLLSTNYWDTNLPSYFKLQQEAAWCQID